jgi:hypothetical protein
VCKKHGDFLQKSNNHLIGQGCPKCSGKKKLNTVEFIEKSNKIHNNKFDYSEVEYKTTHTKVKIICKFHGIFLQSPNSHLRGQGCLKCGLKENSKKEIEFLDYLKIPKKNRQIQISKFIVDGIDTKNKIIYEFLGNYWHGNPDKFSPSKLNKHLNKTFGELYKKTFKRFGVLKNKGYKILYVWELDWDRFRKNKMKIFNLKEY